MYGKRFVTEVGNKPGPNHYMIQSQFEKNKDNRSKTFGYSYNVYAKCFPIGIKNYRPLEEARVIPGPGAYFETRKYDAPPEFAPDKPKYTVCKKGKMFNERITEISPGAIYDNKYSLVEGTRFGTGTGFGYGQKSDFSKLAHKENPGPGAYKLPSIFDKFYSK